MPVSREQMLEELHKAEQARDLLTELERRLAGGNSELEGLLTQLEQFRNHCLRLAPYDY